MKQTPHGVIFIAISTIVILTCIQIGRSIKGERRESERREKYIQRHNELMKELNELSRSQDIRIRYLDSVIKSHNK
jgi:hypothetical protein